MFDAHGYYKISSRGRILYIEAYGPWNLEAAQEFDRLVRKEVTGNLSGSVWAMIANLHGQGIYTPDSIPLLQKLHTWRIESGLRHIAIVHGSRVTKTQFNSIYEADQLGKCAEKYFKSTEDAENWLVSLGYNTDSASEI